LDNLVEAATKKESIIALHKAFIEYKEDSLEAPSELQEVEHYERVKSWCKLIDIEKVLVVPTVTKLPANHILRHVKCNHRLSGIIGSYEALQPNVYLIADKIKSFDQALSIIKHEAWGHRACVTHFGAEFQQNCLDSYLLIPVNKRKFIASEYSLTEEDSKHRFILVQEYIAQASESAEDEVCFLKRVAQFLSINSSVT